MNQRTITLCSGLSVCASLGVAQNATRRQSVPEIIYGTPAGEEGGRAGIRQPVVASLSYDGSSTWGFPGQDFESFFDNYDTFLVERFVTQRHFNITDFHSKAFGDGNPFAIEDVEVAIFRFADLQDMCDDADLPPPVISSVPGTGFFDGEGVVASFGGQCLEPGDYLIRWAARLDFDPFGQIYFFAQEGEHDQGGGLANDGFLNDLTCIQCGGICRDAVDGNSWNQSGINFVLCGNETDQCDQCPDPAQCGDIDGDGDSDGDDFHAFLDLFVNQDSCVDLDQDGDIDAEDFFLFLDRFVQPC